MSLIRLHGVKIKQKLKLKCMLAVKIYLINTGIQKHIIDIAIKLLICSCTEYQKNTKFLKEDDFTLRSIEKFLSATATSTSAVKRECYNN